MTTQIRPYIALLVVVISCLISSSAAVAKESINRATNRHILCAFSSPSLHRHCSTTSISKKQPCHWYSTSIPIVNKALILQQYQSNVKLYQSASSTSSSISNSNNDEYPLIILIGGSGFLGSEIRNQLKQRNLQYIATSTSGKSSTNKSRDEDEDKFIKLDLTSSNAEEQVYQLIMSQLKADDTSGEGSSKKVSIISAMGSIGTDQDEEVNSALSNAIKGAHRVNLSSSTSSSSISSSPESTTEEEGSDVKKNKIVERFIMIGNTDRVRRLASNVPFLKGYASGKEVRYQSRLLCCTDLVVIFYASILTSYLYISLYHIGFRISIERMLWRSGLYYQGKWLPSILSTSWVPLLTHTLLLHSYLHMI